MVTDCILDKRRSDVCWVRRMEDSRMCVRVSVIIQLIVFGMMLTTMVLLMKRRKRNELRVYDYGETGISTEEQYRFCPLHSSYHYTNSTPILPRPPLMPGTRDSYSLAQIPIYTTLWYPLVHTTSWSALSA